MADIRNPIAGSSLVPQAQVAPVRSDAVRAAQRAFFDAALSGVAAASTTLQPRSSPAQAAATPRADTSPPTRLLRPGSLVDIKV